MNGNGHELTTRLALKLLPDWQQKLLAEEAEALCRDYAMYGDTYFVDPETLGPYVEFSDGSVPNFSVSGFRVKNHIRAAVDYWESTFVEEVVRTFTHFGERIAETLRDGKIAAAARFMGTLAHYIEDLAVPAHAVDNGDLEVLKDFFPPPPGMTALRLHGLIEKTHLKDVPVSHCPVVKGDSAAEAAQVLADELMSLVRFSRSLLPSMLTAIYEEDEARLVDGQKRFVEAATGLLADAFHTFLCIGCDRIPEEVRGALQVRPLAPTWPVLMSAWAPEPYSEPAPLMLVDCNLTGDMEPVPCRLAEGGAADSEPGSGSPSLGGTAHFEYAYRFAPGVYRRFAAGYGLHAELGSKVPIRFDVYLDEERVHEDELSPSDRPGVVSLPLPADCTSVRLVSTVADDLDVVRVSGRPLHETGHIVWRAPRLIK